MVKNIIKAGAFTAVAALLIAPSAFADTNTTVTVLPSNTEWSQAGTGANGEVNFVSDPTSPLPSGALQLKTTANPANQNLEKANYSHAEKTALTSINKLSYSAKQVASSFEAGSASYELSTCLYGVTATGCVEAQDSTVNWTNFVYEPYVSEGNTAVQKGKWQTWDVAAGKLRSTRDIGSSETSQSGYSVWTLAQLKSKFPNAVVVGQAVNVGSYNPNYDIYVDAINFNGTIYNFEQIAPVAADTVAPIVTIISPKNGATVQGGVTFKGTVSDDTALMRYYASVLDGNGKQVANSGVVPVTGKQADVSYTVDTRTLADGTYTFKLEVRDAAGNKSPTTSVQTITFVVNNIPDNKDQCKKNGWKTLIRTNGKTFKNQGECVSYAIRQAHIQAHHERRQAHSDLANRVTY
jgi:hypothetical protein